MVEQAAQLTTDDMAGAARPSAARPASFRAHRSESWPGTVRHIAWAAALLGSVAVCANRDWTPLTLRMKTEAIGVAGANAPASAFSPDDTRRLQAVAQAVAAQEEAGAQRAPQSTSTAPAPLPAQPLAPAPQAAALPPAAAPRAIANPAAAAPTSPTTAAQGIEDPEIASKVFGHLAKLAAVEDKAGKPEGTPPVYIFFDPRCPYCHAAFKALQGKVAARWIPVVVLGQADDGKAMARSILAASNPVEALRATFNKQGMRGAGSAELDARLTENVEAFAAIFQASPQLRPGVPTFFIPRPDGRLTMLTGYEAGDEAKIEAVLRGS